MIYCTYDDYTADGGTLDEAAFAPLCVRASRLIDRFTFGRAQRHAAICADCRDALTAACCQIIAVLDASARTGAVPGASSISNDGVSVTFASGAMAERNAAEAQSLLAEALGHDPHGLLYRGCF